MFENHCNHNWELHQNDPDNWARIPEFGVLPSEVAFVGFAFPILTPRFTGFLWRVPLWETVKIVRSLARTRFDTLAQLNSAYESVVMSDLLDPEFDPFTDDQAFAFHYELFFLRVENATTRRNDFAGARLRSEDLANAMEHAVRLIAAQPLNSKDLSIAKTDLARSGAAARHGPTKVARTWIWSEWEKYGAIEYANNKTKFCDTYVRLVFKRFTNSSGDPLVISAKQMREVWLKDTPPASKQAG